MKRAPRLLVLVFASALALRADPWRWAALPGYEIFSDVAEPATQEQLQDFLVAYRDFQRLWPTPHMAGAEPALIVFCDTPAEFARLNPKAPANSRDLATEFGGRPAVMENMHLVARPLVRPYNMMSFSLREVYARYHLRMVGERVPPWLEAGLGKLVSGAVCEDDQVRFPALTTDPTLPYRRAGGEPDLREALRQGKFLSLERLLGETQPPPPRAGRNPEPDGSQESLWGMLPSGLFVDESYEFTQFCLFGAAGRYRAAFIKFAQAASNGPPDEAAFRQCFGLDYDAMLLNLWRYVEVGQGQTFELADLGAGPVAAPPVLKFQAAPEAAVRRMEEEWKAAPPGYGRILRREPR
ncbi:MAG TPA: hypothetical protein VHC86_05865 [Opitutaceae bacterium]|nr:hypothetical protein [Opitutaceae bacterium]